MGLHPVVSPGRASYEPVRLREAEAGFTCQCPLPCRPRGGVTAPFTDKEIELPDLSEACAVIPRHTP